MKPSVVVAGNSEVANDSLQSTVSQKEGDQVEGAEKYAGADELHIRQCYDR